MPSPYGGQNRIILTRREYIIWISIALAVMATIFLFVFELRHFNNTFKLGRMFLITTLFAAGIGTWIMWRLKPTLKDTIDSIRVSLMVYLGLVALLFLATHFINRNLTLGETRTETYPFLQHELYRKDVESIKDEQPLIKTYIQTGNDMKRLVSRGYLYNEATDKGEVSVQVKRGILGFKVAKFKN